MAMTFKERVKEVVRRIPRGTVLTYREVAKRAGSPSASRAVGNIMRGNFALDVPCHRVVHSDGTIGDYNRGGAKAKAARLKKEGVRFSNRRVVRQNP